MKLYCEKKPSTGEYRHFFPSKMQVAICCSNRENIIEVDIEEATEGNGTHWAFKKFKDNSLNFIFETEIQVKMCSPDFFKSVIKEGKGAIVEVMIKEI